MSKAALPDPEARYEVVTANGARGVIVSNQSTMPPEGDRWVLLHQGLPNSMYRSEELAKERKEHIHLHVPWSKPEDYSIVTCRRKGAALEVLESAEEALDEMSQPDDRNTPDFYNAVDEMWGVADLSPAYRGRGAQPPRALDEDDQERALEEALQEERDKRRYVRG